MKRAEEIEDQIEDQEDDVVDEMPADPFSVLQSDDELGEQPDLLGEEDDPEEMERRRLAYSELKKHDKVFNNSYTMGGAEEDEERRSHTGIKLDISSPDHHLYDKDQQSDYIDNVITQKDIHNFVSTNQRIREILNHGAEKETTATNTVPDPGEKKKFTKEEINEMFDIIRIGVVEKFKSKIFVNSIYVLDSISSFTGLEYKKLFDMLTYENKEILLLELDKNYHILTNPPKSFKIHTDE